jgi:hypothetical protein
LVLNNTSLDHSGAGTLDLSAGVLRGTGNIQAVSAETRPKVINRGVLHPGNPAGNLVMQATGGFEQTSTGELVFTVGAAGAGALRLERTSAVLAGTLRVELADGFSPAIGQTYSLMSFPSRTGAFDTVRLPDLGVGKGLEIRYTDIEVILRVVAR